MEWHDILRFRGAKEYLEGGEMNRIEEAKSTIENVCGFTDTSTAVGEAWQVILFALEEAKEDMRHYKYLFEAADRTKGDYLRRLNQSQKYINDLLAALAEKDREIERLRDKEAAACPEDIPDFAEYIKVLQQRAEQAEAKLNYEESITRGLLEDIEQLKTQLSEMEEEHRMYGG